MGAAVLTCLQKKLCQKIFWSTNAISGTLQGKSSLSPGNNWANIGPGTIVGSQYVVTEPLGTAPKFYRLVQ